jgi:hypothetical protein
MGVEKREHLLDARSEKVLRFFVGAMRWQRWCWVGAHVHQPGILCHQLGFLKSGYKFLKQLPHEVVLHAMGQNLGKGRARGHGAGALPTVRMDDALHRRYNHTVCANNLPTLVTLLFMPVHTFSFPRPGGTGRLSWGLSKGISGLQFTQALMA